jgi:hypothetical protein
MSASSHTRDHRYAAELTAAVLAWLERHGRQVSEAASDEGVMSKVSMVSWLRAKSC